MSEPCNLRLRAMQLPAPGRCQKCWAAGGVGAESDGCKGRPMEPIDLPHPPCIDELERRARELMSLIATGIRHQREIANGVEGEGQRLTAAEPERWLANARTDFERGFMALRRAVEQPAGWGPL